MIPKLILESPMCGEQTAVWTTVEERAAAAAFGSERRRREYLTWRAVVRRELGRDVQIEYDRSGAPVIPNRNVCISVSHCPGRVAVCFSDRSCAVDIEPQTRDFGRATSRYMNPSEQALSTHPLLAAVVWCAKEALYKLAGRQQLDLLEDLRIERVDLQAGHVVGRIRDGEPVLLTLRCEEGFIVVHTL